MITEIKLTPRRMNLLNSLDIKSLKDLVSYYPKKYEDLTVCKLNNKLDGCKVTCLCQIYSEIKVQRIKSKLTRMQFLVEIDKEIYTLTIFNREYLTKLLYINKYIKITGKLDYYNKNILVSNIYFDINEEVITSYKLVEGLKDNEFKKIVNEGINYYENLKDNLNAIPDEFISKYRLYSKLDSIKLVHFPSNIDDVKKGYRHLKYEELLEFVTTLEINKRKFKLVSESDQKKIDKDKIENFISTLPYKLSEAQQKATEEIIKDIESSQIMYRLLQGDVGSGKTLVAILALVAASYLSYQGAFMAPTDLLARQHYKNISNLLKNTGIKVALLVSEMSSIDKKQIKENLRKGKIDIIIGTHALIQKDVEFKNLGLAVVDEQHRFGVKQRQQLKQKGQSVNLLLMSATPIPRTLAHTIYGELDISTIDEFPTGKRDVQTIFIEEKNENKMLNDIKFLINQGKKVYVVCPLIEGNNKKSVSSVYEKYQTLFKKNGVGYLHGKLDDKTKEQTLNDFNDGKINLLVSTTVIEVGIDIKNAVAIVVYGANNFGLAQLHQLRGRVGRHGEKGYCYLVSDKDDEESNERLKFLCNEDDGFNISAYDMQKRGVGDIIGTKQSGVSDLKVANIIDDYHILEVARKDCKTIFSNLNKLEFKKYIEYVESKLNKNMAVIG